MPSRIGKLVLAAAFGLNSLAHAAEPVEYWGAENLTHEGLEAFEAGRYEEAREKLTRALELAEVPMLALYAARTNVKLAQWLKASELYLLVLQLDTKARGEPSQSQARLVAEGERGALLERIPRLTIMVKGEDLDEVRVTLDGEVVPKAVLGANQLIDPGRHLIRATRGGQSVDGELHVVERQHRRVTIHFDRLEQDDSQTLPSIATSTERRSGALPSRGSTASAVQSRPGQLPTQAPVESARGEDPFVPRSYLRELDEARSRDDDATRKALGWTSLAMGGAGFVLGTTAGLMASSARRGLLDAGCTNRQCAPEQSADVDEYNRLRVWSTIGFVAGGVFATLGATVLLTKSKDDAKRVALQLGPTSATLHGRF